MWLGRKARPSTRCRGRAAVRMCAQRRPGAWLGESDGPLGEGECAVMMTFRRTRCSIGHCQHLAPLLRLRALAPPVIPERFFFCREVAACVGGEAADKPSVRPSPSASAYDRPRTLQRVVEQRGGREGMERLLGQGRRACLKLVRSCSCSAEALAVRRDCFATLTKPCGRKMSCCALKARNRGGVQASGARSMSLPFHGRKPHSRMSRA